MGNSFSSPLWRRPPALYCDGLRSGGWKTDTHTERRPLFWLTELQALSGYENLGISCIILCDSARGITNAWMCFMWISIGVNMKHMWMLSISQYFTIFSNFARSLCICLYCLYSLFVFEYLVKCSLLIDWESFTYEYNKWGVNIVQDLAQTLKEEGCDIEVDSLWLTRCIAWFPPVFCIYAAFDALHVCELCS